ncbi:uncharacterized protein LOC129921129 [Episyrphus balteatus]|uniref:uncharacterized protein LOC129921129 n=1 Tax=Episyrphus balteatus TaxID=286459 RepID=UPI00248546C9|nr:uncharacterized protein LOC129921129 [Episyrphus balteatus]
MVLNGLCCMKLRTAGLILGWLGLAMSIFTISGTISRLLRYDPDADLYETPYDQYHRHRTLQSDVILLILSIVNVIVTGMLINGITANKHRFIMPWLIVKGLGLILVIPIGFLVLAAASMSGQTAHIVGSIVLLLIIGICCWFWMAIYSLYKEIQAATVKKPLTYFENGAKNGETIPYQLFEKY